MRNKAERIPNVGKASSPYAEAVRIKTETSAGALKTVLVALILLIQFVGIIYLSLYFVAIATWTFALSFIFSLTTCIAVLSSNKNSMSKAVWIIFILVCFTFGYILYIMSDERLFFRKAKKRYNIILERSKEFLPKNSAVIENKAVVSDAKYLLNSGHFPACDQTSLNYFSSGSSFFEDVMESIKKAEKFIFIEFFIISDGLLFNRVSDLLKERAKEGVDVRIIYDDMGSHKTLSSKNKTMLKNAGIKVVAFNRLIPIFSLALNIRDHRKIIVIDGKTAYTGGCNLADEYVNEKRMYGYWKDSSIRLDGMAVDSFTVMFLRQWEFLTKKAQNYSAYVGQYEKVQASCAVIPYADGLDYQKNIAKGVYENMISSAQEKIMIMTPYFIVDDTIIELIINKVTSGVEVSLVIPEIPDKKYAYGITRSNAEKLIDYGVKVFVMKNAFVHSKVVLTENAVVVGSINTDFRSFYQQFECAVYTDDSNFINLVEKDFEKTISVSSRITQRTKFRRSFLYRIYVGLMQLFAPFM